ncbi:MAG TPA: 30S ribosomal protein S20 [Gammaproteobacteria bacterium]|nr:30S ribosomal protein S20 [Gammaproteobacteria bacterium]
MANTKQAKKRARQGEARRVRNASQRSEMRTQVKTLLKIIEKGDLAEANAVLRKTASILDKSAKKGLIHKNKAARTKSRLNARVKKLVKK